MRADPYVLKLAIEDTQAREVFGLRAARGLAPTLVAHATRAQLLERASRTRRFDALAALDVDASALLVMERLVGREANASDVTETAATLRLLHGRRLRSGPALAVPADLARILALTRERVRAIREARVVDARTVHAIERAVRRAGAHVETWWRRGLVAGARVLCHGDVRWHNLVVARASSDRPRVMLLDLEHAGLGDAAVDLAMFSAGSSLTRDDELLLLDAYLHRTTRARASAFIDRFFAQKPLVALLGALDAALELVSYVRSDRSGARTPREQWALREREVRERLGEAIERDVPRLGRTSRARAGARGRARTVVAIAAIVAIDGHAAAGKSVIARGLARALGVSWINTGAAYRWAALVALERGLVPRRTADRAALARHLVVARAGAALDDDGGIVVDGHRLTACLGVQAIDRVVSTWAADANVRAALAPILARAVRRVARHGGVVEGRDVGTLLLPRARHKLFVTASLAQRSAFVAAKEGRATTTSAARALVSSRDALDETRAIAPLAVAADARVLDTTGLDEAQAIARALTIVRAPVRRKAR